MAGTWDVVCIAVEQAESALTERHVKRIEAYALSLELTRHRGLPDPVLAVCEAAQKLYRER